MDLDTGRIHTSPVLAWRLFKLPFNLRNILSESANAMTITHHQRRSDGGRVEMGRAVCTALGFQSSSFDFFVM